MEMELGLGRYWGVGRRRCGACAVAPAAVYCRTCDGDGGGGGYLCAGCDAEHGRAGHERVWVCEVCELAPAAVTCKADAAALCAACDSDIHDANPLARRHERVPVHPIGSSAAPPPDALLLGGENDAAAAVDGGGGGKEVKLDFLFADFMDPYLGGSPELARFPHADSVVPNHNGSAGPAMELGFAGGGGAAVKPSYSSYTAASLGNSVSSCPSLPRSRQEHLAYSIDRSLTSPICISFDRAGLVVGGRAGAGRHLRRRRRRNHRARLRAVQGGLPAIRLDP
jgi:hypothetical protein